MNTIERLREAKQRNRCVNVTVCGAEVRLQPLTVSQAQPLIKQFSEVVGLNADDPRLVELYVELIARCAVELDTGELALDSEEGRELIRELPMQDLFEFGFAAAEASGLGGRAGDNAAKKN